VYAEVIMELFRLWMPITHEFLNDELVAVLMKFERIDYQGKLRVVKEVEAHRMLDGRDAPL
jgi:hypothetical protein